MMVNNDCLVPMTDVEQDFSRVIRTVDDNGMAIILKNDKPRYIVVDFDEYELIVSDIMDRKERIDSAVDKILSENMEAFLELAK